MASWRDVVNGLVSAVPSVAAAWALAERGVSPIVSAAVSSATVLVSWVALQVGFVARRTRRPEFSNALPIELHDQGAIRCPPP